MKFTTKTISTVLLAIVLASPISTIAATQEVPLTDVTGQEWFYDSIKYVYQKGIMTGTSDKKFRPFEPITRGALMKVVMEAKFSDDEIANCTTSYFTDVAADDVFAKYICLGKEKGIISGYGDKTFRSGYFVSFEQAAKIIAKLYYPDFAFATSTSPNKFISYMQKLEEVKAIPTSSFSHEPTSRFVVAEMIYRLDTKNTTRKSFPLKDILVQHIEMEINSDLAQSDQKFEIFVGKSNKDGMNVNSPENIRGVYKLATIRSGSLEKIRITDNEVPVPNFENSKEKVDATGFEVYLIEYKYLIKYLCGKGEDNSQLVIYDRKNNKIYLNENPNLFGVQSNVFFVDSKTNDISGQLNIKQYENRAQLTDNFLVKSQKGLMFGTEPDLSQSRKPFDGEILTEVDSVNGNPVYISNKSNPKLAKYYQKNPNGLVVPIELDFQRFFSGKKTSISYSTSAAIKSFENSNTEVWDTDNHKMYYVFDKQDYDFVEVDRWNGLKIYKREISQEEFDTLEKNTGRLVISRSSFNNGAHLLYIESPDGKLIEILDDRFGLPIDNC